MAMSKKHYTQIAECFQRAFADVRTIRDKAVKDAVNYQLSGLVNDVAKVFGNDNLNFDKMTFFKACAKIAETEQRQSFGWDGAETWTWREIE